jgi:hypothetical protein
MRRAFGFLLGLGLALASFDATVLLLKLTHHDQACICISKVGR